jgi:TRAP-type C4-dicarboxylate transport system permease small subunit
MNGIFVIVRTLSRLMYWIAGIALAMIVFLVVADVILRRFRMPIDWALEVVVLLGAIAIGFSIPQTTIDKGHVSMDFVTERLSKRWQMIFSVITKGFGIVMFAIFGWRIFPYGNNLMRSGQVSPILEIPEYPVAYGIGICCFVVCLVLFRDLLEKIASQPQK